MENKDYGKFVDAGKSINDYPVPSKMGKSEKKIGITTDIFERIRKFF